MEINLNFLGIDSFIINNIHFYKIAIILLLSFIIIYLVRPKSVKKIIPSLMFLILNKKKGKFNSFFRRLLIEPLFLLQLLILLFMIFAIFSPILTYQYDLSDENTIFVLDLSASMNAEGRFDELKDIVKENAVGSITTVVIKERPHVYFEDEIPKKAIELIDILKPTKSTSNIVEAIKIADELMANKTGRILVISDFKDSENSFKDLLDIKGFLEAKDRIIEYHVLEPKQNNIGFINAEFVNNEITLFIKNYNHETAEINIDINNQRKEIQINPRSIEIIRFIPQSGRNVVEILNKDDFMLDNKFYAYIPDNRNMNVLLITNNRRTYLHDFLRSSPYIDLDITEPPLIPNTNYDAIIFDNVRREFMLTLIKDELKKYVSEGGSLIVTRTGDIERMDMDELIPVEMISETIYNMQTRTYEEITKDLVFGRIINFRNAQLKNGTAPIVDTINNVVVAYSKFNNGMLLYYGIPEEENDFKLTISYPIFWHRVLRFITNFNDYESVNLRTNFPGLENEIGFIEQNRRTIAVNLLNEIESDVTADSGIISFIEEIEFERKSMMVTKTWNFNYIIISLIILLLFLELLFIKYRGDI